MARITVEDCLELIPNRFELVMVAAKRARELEGGEIATIPEEHDKCTVVALREIALGNIDASILNPLTRKIAAETDTQDSGESGEAL